MRARKHSRAAGGRMAVIVGVSHPGTRATVELGAMAAELGADALMVAPSAEPVPSEARVAEYLSRVCAGVSLPVVLQDHPASTGVHMSVPTMENGRANQKVLYSPTIGMMKLGR